MGERINANENLRDNLGMAYLHTIPLERQSNYSNS